MTQRSYVLTQLPVTFVNMLIFKHTWNVVLCCVCYVMLQAVWFNSDSDITVNKHLNKATNICQVKPSFILPNSFEKKSGVWSYSDSCPDSYVSGLNVDMVFRDFQQLKFSSHLACQGCCSRIYFLILCIEADDVWLVLSRSWPATHFLPSGKSNSRVKFIWYPWICTLWNCKVSWFGPPNLDTLVSAMTLFHLW